jgi:membrane-bound ClpP family serine protease
MPRSSLLLAAATTALLGNAGAQERAVYLVSIAGGVDAGQGRLIARALREAGERHGAALVLQIGSPGGRFDDAQLMVGDLAAAEVPVYALVSPHAWGAAAILALAADSVFMTREATIGAGSETPSPIDAMSPPARRALRTEFTTLAERRGADPAVGAAMVDEGVSVPNVADRPGRLTLGVDDAVRLGVAAARVDGLPDLLRRLGRQDDDVVTITTAWTGTTVEIANNNWRDLRVYVNRSGSRFRLGTVTSMNDATYSIPSDILVPGARIRIVVEIIGSNDALTTPEVPVESGLVIQWNVENYLSNSTFFYFVRDD